MAPKESTENADPLIRALDKLGEGSGFLWLIFIFTITPTIFNGLHSMSYIFIAEDPHDYWCSVNTLTNANWTDQQIKNISSESPCTIYKYNYEYFKEIGFERALEYKRNNELPSAVPCNQRTFEKDTHGTSIAQEWDLVCENIALRSTTHMALSLGKLMGSAFFGVFADRFGRKLSYAIGIVLLIVSGPTSAIIPWYWGFVVLRYVTGVSHAAIQYSAFTTLTEVAGEKHRRWMGIAYNVGYATGTSLTPGVAYLLTSWRHIQMAISLPALILLIHMWLMPESPRWLITQNRRDEARVLIEKASKSGYQTPELDSKSKYEDDTNDPTKTTETETKTTDRLRKNIQGIRLLVTNSELRKRLLITNFSWMTASLSYYALALNVNNFSADRYIYVLIMGLTEIPAYLIPTPILMTIGRRPATGILYCLSAVFLLCILLIPVSMTTTIMVVALTGRFVLSTVYGIVILYTSELFPTVSRNSAIGMNSAMSHVGSVAAPYVADLLGAIVWWAPSTLCGVLALIAGLLCSMLPETRGKSLSDTADEETLEDRNLVSLENCCKCSTNSLD